MSKLVGSKIKQIRELKGISQKQMADYLHLSESGYAKLEQGEGRLHTERLEKIAQMLEIEVNDLLDSDTRFLCVVNESGTMEVSCINQNNNYQNQDLIIELIKSKDNLIEQQKQHIQLLQHTMEMMNFGK